MRFGFALACLMALASGCSNSRGMKAAPADAAPDAIASADLAPTNGTADAAQEAIASGDLAPDRGNTDAARDSAEGDAIPPRDLAATENADGSTCWQPDYPLPAPVTCSSTVLACDAGKEDCLFTSAGRAMMRLVQECRMYCGEFRVGFVAGCAAEIRDVFPTNTELATCLSNAILGQRWTCTPENGWVRVYVGSCTLA